MEISSISASCWSTNCLVCWRKKEVFEIEWEKQYVKEFAGMWALMVALGSSEWYWFCGFGVSLVLFFCKGSKTTKKLKGVQTQKQMQITTKSQRFPVYMKSFFQLETGAGCQAILYWTNIYAGVRLWNEDLERIQGPLQAQIGRADHGCSGSSQETNSGKFQELTR